VPLLDRQPKESSLRRTCIALVAVTLAGILSPASVQAQPESNAQLFLDPTTVPPDFYTYTLESSGSPISFTNVSRIQVLPALQQGNNSYLYTPNVDYSATLSGSNGTLFLDHAGPYIVETTSSIDGSHAFTSFGVGFVVNPAATGPTYNWHMTDVPNADTYVVDPAVAASQPTFPAGSTVKNNLATWNDVLNYLKTLTNAHVELSGHGNVGQFYYNGMLVLDDTTAATQATLDMLKGHVKELTFMSCLTGQGAGGQAFLQNVANTLGASSGYTDCVGGDGTKWYVNDDGKRVSFIAVPEPGILALFALGGGIFAVGTRVRRNRKAA
jgi:hypothetical protein